MANTAGDGESGERQLYERRSSFQNQEMEKAIDEANRQFTHGEIDRAERDELVGKAMELC